jgi:phage terminase large subunit-like protein
MNRRLAPMNSTTSKTACDLAREYCRDVLEGRKIAGELERLASERFEFDLARQGTADFPYIFDEAKANRACAFMQRMPHVKGRWARNGGKLVFEPWQCFIECNVFGWVHMENGLRRFRRAYEEEGRKNGKSMRMAARGIFLFCADEEPGAEVYCGATTEKQAHEIFRPAWQMVRALQRLRERYHVEQSGNPKNPGPMYVTEDMSRFEALIGKPGDGASPSAAMIDEYHEHESDHMVDAMETGMGAREQPLLSIITTAGTNLAGPCYEMRQDMVKILRRTVVDETIFVIIFCADPEDQWDSDAAIKKANPNLGVSVFEAYLHAQLMTARRSAAKQNTFRTKHLCQWVGARVLWMNALGWQRQRRTATMNEYKGRRAWIATDLNSKKDVAASTALIEISERELICIPTFFVPEKAVEENETYRKFITSGHMIETPGAMTDYAFIEEHLKATAKILDVQDFSFDDWQANYLMTRMAGLSIKVVDFNQTVRNMSEPMKEVEARILARTLWHDDNPVMNWMMGNVAAKIDAKQNIYPRKERENDDNCKIDGPVTLIMAMGRYLSAAPTDNMAAFFNRPVVSA